MTEETRFVATDPIRQAVAGREADVLDAIGVDWRRGRPHIVCPYRDHADDNASWRWDDKHAKARCTCTKGDSIFDVVMKVEGGDFEAAKVRVAELLNLHDLIRTKGGAGNGQRHQATDADSLLSAPAERRDDALPAAYLAHRLGVAVPAVPIPSTPMVGLKALGYYDPPPPASRAKPKLVGEFPCAVFGTIAADGRTHAHRIYLAPAGAGKADLGVGSDGRRRDPKKSAKVTGGDNMAGRAVLWGDPGRAPHIVVTEGIETGAAVALALATEIAAGEIAVAAAISANGVEAFQPYPATVRVTIAADRDEAAKANGKPGSRRGEQAARAFGLKHYQRINVTIALPGAAGEAVDWLDVLVRDGADPVRVGILSASSFVPTATELGASGEPEDDAEQWPFRLTWNGVEKRVERVDREIGVTVEWKWFCSLLEVPAETRSSEGEEWGRLLRVTDRDGRVKEWGMPMSMLAGDGTAYRERLLSLGLIMAPGKFARDALHEYISTARPDTKARCVARVGWHSRAFTLSNQTVEPDHG